MVLRPRILVEVSVFPIRLLVLCVGILLASCGRYGTDEHVDGALRPYVPPDAHILAGIDIKALKQSTLLLRHPEVLRRIPLDKRASLLGLDPRQNLDEALLAWRTTANDSVLLVHGSFSAALLEPRLRNLGARREMNTERLLWATPKGSVLFPQDNVAVLGARTAVVPSEMILLRKGAGSSIPESLGDLLQKAPEGEQVWLASASPIQLEGFHLREEISSALQNFTGSIKTVSMGVHVTDQVQYRADLQCVSREGAVRVKDALGGALALAHIGTDENRLLRWALDDVHIEQSGTGVQVRARIGSGLAEQLLSAIR